MGIGYNAQVGDRIVRSLASGKERSGVIIARGTGGYSYKVRYDNGRPMAESVVADRLRPE